MKRRNPPNASMASKINKTILPKTPAPTKDGEVIEHCIWCSAMLPAKSLASICNACRVEYGYPEVKE